MLKNRNYPHFSVLMSVYNKEKASYLDKALMSVENQTVIPDEIIIVEDGPISIELKKVISKHKKKFGRGFKNVISEKNQGLGAALRLGTKYVSTNWIARMDSDDISVPNRFEIQLKEIIRKPNIAVVGGQVTEFAENKEKVGIRRVPLSNKEITTFIKWRSPFNHPSVMINKRILQEVGGYIPYGNLEDYYLWARIIIGRYPVCNVNKSLVLMRVDEGMYQRRGKISNIKYFYQLREFLYKHNILTWSEKVAGNCLMTINIILPRTMRKLIYQRVLHKK